MEFQNLQFGNLKSTLNENACQIRSTQGQSRINSTKPARDLLARLLTAALFYTQDHPIIVYGDAGSKL